MTALQHAGPFEHPALFYRDDAEFLAAVRRFVRAAARSVEPVMVAVPTRNLHLLRSYLGDECGDIDFRDMSVDGRNPGRIIGDLLQDFVGTHTGGRVHVVSESIWAGRDATEYPACAQNEALINMALRNASATILCPYNVAELDPDVIDDARRTHPTLWMDYLTWDSADYEDPRTTAESFNVKLEAEPRSAVAMSVHAHNLDKSRRFTAAGAIAAGVANARIADAVLAIDELISNTVTHGGGFGRLATWIEERRAVFEVADSGVIEDPLAGRRATPPDQENGRGLAIVHRICDLVRVHTGPDGTAVRVYFDLG